MGAQSGSGLSQLPSYLIGLLGLPGTAASSSPKTPTIATCAAAAPVVPDQALLQTAPVRDEDNEPQINRGQRWSEQLCYFFFWLMYFQPLVRNQCSSDLSGQRAGVEGKLQRGTVGALGHEIRSLKPRLILSL